MICRHTSFSLLFFSHYSLYVIGKAIDPDGVKAFDDDYYLRFTCLYKQYHRDAPALDELQKFSGEEESSSPMACLPLSMHQQYNIVRSTSMGADDDDAVAVDVAVAAVVVAVNIIQRTITFITLSCPNFSTSH
jgi:hypothetical protein